MKHTYIYEQTHYDGSFPVSIWNYGADEAIEMIYCNWHKEVEFIYVRRGTLNLYVDEKLNVIHTGEIGVVNTNRLHYGLAAFGDRCEISVMVFNLEQLLVKDGYNERHLLAMAHDELWFPSVITPQMSIYTALTELMGQMNTCWALRPCAFELKLKSLLLDLLFLFATNEKYLTSEREWGTSKSREKKEKLLALTSYLNAHYSEEISISALAERMYMSKEALYKFTTSMTGCSPLAFINQFRLLKAATLLETTNLSVTDVCFQTGFSNVSYFIRCFRKMYGCTPKKFSSEKNDPLKPNFQAVP